MKKSIEDYERDIAELKEAIRRDHGLAVAQRIFQKATPSKRGIKADKDLLMLADYLLSGLSVQRYATMLAKKNKTNPYAVEKQIHRIKKRLAPFYLKYTEWAQAVTQRFQD
jgi:hypothetical protein